jgi:hypothetical protein
VWGTGQKGCRKDWILGEGIGAIEVLPILVLFLSLLPGYGVVVPGFGVYQILWNQSSLSVKQLGQIQYRQSSLMEHRSVYYLCRDSTFEQVSLHTSLPDIFIDFVR